jgi:hypothetical protein
MTEDFKPHDDTMIEAIAREMCIMQEIDPDAMLPCCDCDTPHPMWESQTADIDMFLTAARAAGLRLVGAQ